MSAASESCSEVCEPAPRHADVFPNVVRDAPDEVGDPAEMRRFHATPGEFGVDLDGEAMSCGPAATHYATTGAPARADPGPSGRGTQDDGGAMHPRRS